MPEVVPFSAHVNRATNNVQKLEWSPVNDLVAVVCKEPAVTLYRLPWQRVWTHSTEIPPSALQWSPDGNQLAVGLANGVITTLSKEDGTVISTIKDNSRPVVVCDWIEFVESHSPDSRSFQNLTLQLKKLFKEVSNQLPTQPTSVGRFYEELSTTQEELRFNPDSEMELPSLLITARGGGAVTCYLQGRVPIIQFDSAYLTANPNKEEISINAVSLANDLSSILVLQSVHPGSANPALAANSIVQLLLCDSQFLTSNLKQIQDLSLRIVEIIDLLDLCENCLKKISSDWWMMMTNLKLFVSLEEVSLADLTNELILFLGQQMITKNLEIFCTKKWSHSTLKGISGEMDSTFRIADEILTFNLRTYIQKAILVVEDLYCLIESSQLLLESTLGIQVVVINELRAKLKWSLVSLDLIQEKMNVMGKQYRLFMCLLLLVQQTYELGDVSDCNVTSRVIDLLDFLEAGLFQDPIGCEFQTHESLGVGSVLMNELKEKKELWAIMSQVLGKHQDTQGLRQQLLKCRHLANDSLLEIKDTITKQITLKEKVNLGGGVANPIDRAKLVAFHDAESSSHKFLVLLNCLEGRLRNGGVASIMVMQGTIKGHSKTLSMKIEPSMVFPPSNLSVLDLALCRTSQLLLLMTDNTTAQAEVVSVELTDWPFIEVPPVSPSNPLTFEEFVKGMKDHGIDLLDLPRRQRTHKYIGVRAPFAVSNRDLVIVLSDHRVMIYDLATDDQID